VSGNPDYTPISFGRKPLGFSQCENGIGALVVGALAETIGIGRTIGLFGWLRLLVTLCLVIFP
jgi:hypothetical protein